LRRGAGGRVRQGGHDRMLARGFDGLARAGKGRYHSASFHPDFYILEPS
jgi:hypothetical protein